MSKNFINLKELTQSEQRKLLLNILAEIDSFCKSHNIMYFLYFGTLLGAVRHQGFIPWDDDIDIAMPRPDYERFISEFKADGLYLFNYRTHNKMLMPFTKVCSDKTVGFFENKVKLEYGLSIDVLPIDGSPEDEKLQEEFYKKQQRVFLNFFIRGQYLEITNFSHVSGAKSILVKFLHPFFRSSKWAKVIDHNAQQYRFETCRLCKTNVTFFDVSPKLSYSKECISSQVMMDFEGKQYSCPIGYDEILKTCYGDDYMIPPPPNKRCSAHQVFYYWKENIVVKDF